MAPRTRSRLELEALRLAAGVAAVAGLGCVNPGLPPVPYEGNIFSIGPSGGRSFDRKVVSLREQRWRGVVRQRLDYSCGAAALATLLQHHYDDPVDEGEIIQQMLVLGDAERVRSKGFSMLDLQNFVRDRGYQGRGYRIEPQVLERLKVPSLTMIGTQGYTHFVVLRGVRDGYVYLADPALGQRTMRMHEFREQWVRHAPEKEPGDDEAGVIFIVAAPHDDSETVLTRLAGRPGPAELVRPLDDLGLRHVRVAGPAEF